MKNKPIQYGLHFLFFLTAYSCTFDKANNNISPVVSNCSSIVPDSVSFSKNVQPLLTNNCAISGCHSGGSPAGSLNLQQGEAYNQLTKKGSGYVNVGNPQSSILYSSLVSSSQPMPPTGNLDNCSIELITKWMQQNAKNN